MPCPDKPEGEKTIYHETTKIRNHEKEHKNFCVFVGTFILFITKTQILTLRNLHVCRLFNRAYQEQLTA